MCDLILESNSQKNIDKCVCSLEEFYKFLPFAMPYIIIRQLLPQNL